MPHQGIQVGSWALLILAVLLRELRQVDGNAEGDALHALRQAVNDPTSALQSWDPTLVNPCTWFHITCNPENRVIRMDLGHAHLSGQLVSQLGELTELQYLELYSNNISGHIPKELGKLTNLVSLDLYQNQFSGRIPQELGRMSSLRFLRLNNNSLQGQIPVSLTNIRGLQVLDLSNNNLTGEVPGNGSFSRFTPLSYGGNPSLCGATVHKQCPGGPPLLPPQNTNQSPSSQGGAIARGVAVGAALLFAAPAIGFACLWRRRRLIGVAQSLQTGLLSEHGLAERREGRQKVEEGWNQEVELVEVAQTVGLGGRGGLDRIIP